MSSIHVVTIDGPAGAGKSTVAREVARRLGYRFLDTGAMFRALTLLAMERGIAAEESPELQALAKEIVINFGANGQVLVNGSDRSTDIRTREVTGLTSAYASLGCVRESMAAAQRRIGLEGHLVCEGRDMGTVVFPEAKARIYLDASAEVRAERRAKELEDAGRPVDRQLLIEEIRTRDHADSTREIAPLKRIAEQHYIDSSNLEREEVISAVLNYARRCLVV